EPWLVDCTGVLQKGGPRESGRIPSLEIRNGISRSGGSSYFAVSPETSPRSPLSPPSRFAPILFGLALDRRCRRILDLHPIPRAARAVARILALAHNAFASKQAGMLEHEWSVVLVLGIEYQPRAWLAHQPGQEPPTLHERHETQVTSVEFN